MPAYRLYFMDSLTGHIVYSQDFGAEDDFHAIAKASELQGRTPMELWCQSRKVHRWEANPTYSFSVLENQTEPLRNLVAGESATVRLHASAAEGSDYAERK